MKLKCSIFFYDAEFILRRKRGLEFTELIVKKKKKNTDQ